MTSTATFFWLTLDKCPIEIYAAKRKEIYTAEQIQLMAKVPLMFAEKYPDDAAKIIKCIEQVESFIESFKDCIASDKIQMCNNQNEWCLFFCLYTWHTICIKHPEMILKTWEFAEYATNDAKFDIPFLLNKALLY